MRRIDVPHLATPVSALGFGCASLGSRISAEAGRVAIARAVEAGVTWFDVAPSYGDGAAEEILGEALAGADVAILTKVGRIADPPRGLARAVKHVLRPLVAAAPALRGAVKALRPNAARRLPLTGDVVRASLETSLKRLKRTRLAGLALHEPNLDEVQDEGVIRALREAKAAGLVANIAIAGTLDTFVAARSAGLDATILQTANPPFERHVQSAEILPGPLRPAFTITHSVIGVGGAFERMSRLVAREPKLAETLAGLDHGSPLDLCRFLIDDAFDGNPRGIVLLSAYRPEHLALGAAAAARAPDAARARVVAEIVNEELTRPRLRHGIDRTSEVAG